MVVAGVIGTLRVWESWASSEIMACSWRGSRWTATTWGRGRSRRWAASSSSWRMDGVRCWLARARSMPSLEKVTSTKRYWGGGVCDKNGRRPPPVSPVKAAVAAPFRTMNPTAGAPWGTGRGRTSRPPTLKGRSGVMGWRRYLGRSGVGRRVKLG